MSHPTRVRGLKWTDFHLTCRKVLVAPHPGAWIEIGASGLDFHWCPVAPHPGAWIEIPVTGEVRS